MSGPIQSVYVREGHAAAFPRAERNRSAERASWFAVLARLFVMIVTVPTLLSAIYYAFLAAPQYQATVRMAVFTASVDAGEATSVLSDTIGGGNGDEKPGDLGKLASNQGAAKRIVGQAEQLMRSTLGRAGDGRDPYIVAAYIRSLAIIGDLNHDGWLTHVFADELADPLARMDGNASREILWRTFNRHVDARVDSLSGLITVNARTFSPATSKELVSRIVNASERLVNETRARSLNDATSIAEETLRRAETRYLDALSKVRQLRENVGVIDPGQGAMALAKALTELKVIKATLEMQYYGTKASVSADSPMARALAARIAATDKEIAELEKQIASVDATSSAVATYLAEFETLETERLLSQAAYQQAVASADRAQSQADRQAVYLVEFEPPRAPEESRYPRGWRIVLTVFICATALWSVVGLIGAGIRNHVS
jgi:capsular polysaccharide transport system permease protein